LTPYDRVKCRVVGHRAIVAAPGACDTPGTSQISRAPRAPRTRCLRRLLGDPLGCAADGLDRLRS
jgi:hypothetical protein